MEGKVARILNTRELAINLGEENGVSENMIFDVLSRNGVKVLDPDTSEELGEAFRPKVRVKIVTVYERWSVASTFETKRVNVGGLGFSRGGMFNDPLLKVFEPPKWVEKVELLKSDEDKWEDLKEEDSYVKVGDLVVQVTKTQEELGKLPALTSTKSASTSNA